MGSTREVGIRHVQYTQHVLRTLRLVMGHHRRQTQQMLHGEPRPRRLVRAWVAIVREGGVQRGVRPKGIAPQFGTAALAPALSIGALLAVLSGAIICDCHSPSSKFGSALVQRSLSLS
jgi:hypothetical protein